MPGKGHEAMGGANGGHDAHESVEPGGLAGIALADLFERFDGGDNHWHASIQSLLDGLTAEQALWRPAPERHCIWQIVRHMSFWRRYVIAHLEQAPLPDPQTGDWSDPPDLDEDSWKKEREEYNRTQARLLEVVRPLIGSQLTGVVGEEGETRLYHWVAGLLAHDSYHAGQIAYLRAMQGIPVA